MRDIIQQFFGALKSFAEGALALLPGLKNIGPEVGTEVGRLGGLGASELAAALFKGDPFVMYGPNQRSAKAEQEQSLFGHHEPAGEHGQEQQDIGRETTRER